MHGFLDEPVSGPFGSEASFIIWSCPSFSELVSKLQFKYPFTKFHNVPLYHHICVFLPPPHFSTTTVTKWNGLYVTNADMMPHMREERCAALTYQFPSHVHMKLLLKISHVSTTHVTYTTHTETESILQEFTARLSFRDRITRLHHGFRPQGPLI